MKHLERPEHAAGQRADRRSLAEIRDLVEDGIYDTASVLAWELQRMTPGDPEVWLLLAQIDHLRERYAAAMYAARMASRLNPSSPDAWLALSRTAVTRIRWRTEGLDAALQATALAPGNPATWTVLARHHLARGAEYEAAIAAERAVRVGPEDIDAHRVLGDIAAATGEHEHAAAAFRTVLRLAPGDQRAEAQLVTALRAQNIDPAVELTQLSTARPVVAGLGERLARLQQIGADHGAVGVIERARGVLDRLGRSRVQMVVAGLAAGAILGFLVPGLGVLRGLVAATALLLMWFAVRPWRSAEAAGPRHASGASTPQRPLAAEAASATRHRAIDPSIPARNKASDTSAQPAHHKAEHPVPAAAPPEQSFSRADVRRPAETLPDPDLATPAADISPEPTAPSEPDLAAAETAAAAAEAGEPAAARTPDAEGAPASAEGNAENTADRGDVDLADIELPDDTDELVALSHARLAEFDLATARAAATRLLAVAPDSVHAHRALGAVALAQQEYAQAEHHYGQVLDREPLDEEAHGRLALARQGRQRVEQRTAQRPGRRRSRP